MVPTPSPCHRSDGTARHGSVLVRPARRHPRGRRRPDETLPLAAQGGSAFVAYRQGSAAAATSLEQPMMMTSRRGGQYNNNSGGGRGANVHRRMFGYLRRIGDAAAAGNVVADGDAVMMTQTQAPRGSSRFRHIMRERLRRERLSQGFADLHALLPPDASKGGKNDIVDAAAGYIVELEGRRQWLSARNEELLRLEQAARSSGMVVKVRAESEQHSAVAVDVFETVLRRLKAMEVLRVTGIRSCFGDGGMWMNVGVECEVSARDVDKAITNALTELEEKAFRMQVPRSGRPAFSCQAERGEPMC